MIYDYFKIFMVYLLLLLILFYSVLFLQHYKVLKILFCILVGEEDSGDEYERPQIPTFEAKSSAQAEYQYFQPHAEVSSEFWSFLCIELDVLCCCTY